MSVSALCSKHANIENTCLYQNTIKAYLGKGKKYLENAKPKRLLFRNNRIKFIPVFEHASFSPSPAYHCGK